MPQTILIAEDDADIRNLLRLYLESEGYTVLEAPDGRTALDLALSRTPDAAILDVMMPGIERLRADPDPAPHQRHPAADPVRQEPGQRQDPGAEPGRGRLHRQALQPPWR